MRRLRLADPSAHPGNSTLDGAGVKALSSQLVFPLSVFLCSSHLQTASSTKTLEISLLPLGFETRRAQTFNSHRVAAKQSTVLSLENGTLK